MSLSAATLHAKPFVALGVGTFGGNNFIHQTPAYSAEAGFTKYKVSLSAKGMYIAQDTKYPTYSQGKLTMIPVFLQVSGSAPLTKRFSLNAGLGIGYIMASREITRQKFGAIKETEEVESDQAFIVGGGMAYRMNRRVTLTLNFSLLTFNTRLHHTRKNIETFVSTEPTFKRTETLDLGGFMGFLGVRF